MLGVAAGSPAYTGAAVLAVGAAVAAGAGMVRFAGAAHPAEQVRLRWPEAVVTRRAARTSSTAGRVQAWAVGPGLGTDDVAAATVEAVLASDVPVLVDADALTVCAQHPELAADAHRADAADAARPGVRAVRRRRSAATGSGRPAGWPPSSACTCCSRATRRSSPGPDGPARVNRTGTPALAAAGSGDVLTGAVGALLAQGLPVLEAASAGAYLHGRAGALSSDGLASSASRLVAAWPDAVRELLADRLDG